MCSSHAQGSLTETFREKNLFVEKLHVNTYSFVLDLHVTELIDILPSF